MTSIPWRISSRLIVLMALSWPSQIGTAVRTRSGVGLAFISPDHRDARRDAAAHVERQIPARAVDLTRAGALGEVLEGLDDLPDASGAHGVAVADQAAAGIDRDRSGWRRDSQLRAH